MGTLMLESKIAFGAKLKKDLNGPSFPPPTSPQTQWHPLNHSSNKRHPTPSMGSMPTLAWRLLRQPHLVGPLPAL